MNIAWQRLIGEVAEDCAKHSIAFVLANKRRVGGNMETGSMGYFDDVDRILTVAARNKQEEWFRVLIHEWMHMQQWKEGMFLKSDLKSYTDLWDWVEKRKELTKTRRDKVVDRALHIEHDAEARTVALVRQRSVFLNIDPDDYAKKANTYLYFYEVVRRYQTWYKKPPYMVPEIVELMPAVLGRNYKRFPKGYLDLVKKHCI